MFFRRIYNGPPKFIKKNNVFHMNYTNHDRQLQKTLAPPPPPHPPSHNFYFSSFLSNIHAFFEPTTFSKHCCNRIKNLCASQPYYPA